MPTAKGEETKRRVVRAAWELTGRRDVEQMLCGVSLREVAAEAGLTPSAVTYHFPTMADLALGMVEEFVETRSPVRIESVERGFDGVDIASLVDAVRAAADFNWAVNTSADEVAFERRLCRFYSATGDHGAPLELTRLLGRFNRRWVEELTAIYEGVGAATGRVPVEPFTFREIAQIMWSLFEGLQHQWMGEPDSVRADLLSDVAVVIAGVLTTPIRQPVGFEEIGARLSGGRVEPAPDPDRLVAAAATAAPLFSAGIPGVTFAQVADVLDWSPEVVLACFGTLERVAALAFARHLPAIEAAVGRREDAPVELRLADGLYELGRCATSDRHCAAALLVERVERRAGPAVGAPGSEPAAEGRSGGREPVPLERPLRPLVAQLIGGRSAGGSAAEVDTVAQAMVDLVLAQAALEHPVALSQLTELAMRLVRS